MIDNIMPMKGGLRMAAEYIRFINNFCCEYTLRKKGWVMKNMHYHLSYELFVMMSGHTELMSEDHIINLVNGDVALFRKNTLHKNNGGTSHGRYAVNFSERYLSQYFTQDAISELLSCFEHEKISIPKEYFGHVAALLKRMEGHGREYSYLAALLTLLKDISAINDEKRERSGRSNVDSILEYINKNYGTIENVDEIADAVHMSKSYLCQKFKRETDMTITEYLNSIRIKNACKMLSDGCNVTDTSLMCGYSAPSYFCKMFKNIVNMTPSEYRRYDEDMRNI